MFEENVEKFNEIILYAGTNIFDQSCVINQLILNLSYFQGKNVPLNVLFNKQIQCKKVIHIGDKHTIVIKDNAFFEEGIIFSFPTSSFEIDSNKSFLLVDGGSIGDSNSSRFGSIIIKGIHTIISNSIYLDKILIYQAKKVVFNSTVYTNTLEFIESDFVNNDDSANIREILFYQDIHITNDIIIYPGSFIYFYKDVYFDDNVNIIYKKYTGYDTLGEIFFQGCSTYGRYEELYQDEVNMVGDSTSSVSQVNTSDI